MQLPLGPCKAVHLHITVVGGSLESRVVYLHMHIAGALRGLFEGRVLNYGSENIK